MFAAEELGSLIAALEAIDKGLDARPKAASKRMLLEHKNRLSKTLLSYLREIGATPRARWEYARELGEPTFAERVEQRLREGER